MPARSMFEMEVLPFALRQALGHLKVRSSALGAIELGLAAAAAVDDLGIAASNVLREADPTNVDVISAEAPTGSVDSLAARIVAKRHPDGRPARMDFFKVKDASLTLGISLATLAVAIAMLSPSAIGPALNGIKAVYDNWIVLRDARDEDAMGAYDALLRHAAETIAEHVPRRDYGRPSISAANLHEFGGPPLERCLKALKRLKEVGLAEVVTWSGSAGDLDDPENLWAHRA